MYLVFSYLATHQVLTLPKHANVSGMESAEITYTTPRLELIQLVMIPNKETYDKLKTGKDDKLSSHYNNMVSSVFDYAMTSQTQQEATTKGTLFGAYNAVTGYYQNVRNYRDDESKFKSIMYGILKYADRSL